ncbi:hypothetical protein F5Y15DRAFT_94985 [Xylariaceae sp. FL0016]|nr:hypothetical protein F5Y15DRAFT_94985 [Xylariaceae sp. FL0016]
MRRIPIARPATASWGQPITRADFKRLQEGFQPRDMDDKWVCSVDGPTREGKLVVHFCRSWTGIEHITLKVKGDKKASEIVEITWEKGTGELKRSEEEAKDLATILSKNLMGCEWEAVPPCRP